MRASHDTQLIDQVDADLMSNALGRQILAIIGLAAVVAGLLGLAWLVVKS